LLIVFQFDRAYVYLANIPAMKCSTSELRKFFPERIDPSLTHGGNNLLAFTSYPSVRTLDCSGQQPGMCSVALLTLHLEELGVGAGD